MREPVATKASDSRFRRSASHPPARRLPLCRSPLRGAARCVTRKDSAVVRGRAQADDRRRGKLFEGRRKAAGQCDSRGGAKSTSPGRWPWSTRAVASRGKALLGALSRSRELLESSSGDIASLHRQLYVWRLGFVRSLFEGWWVLTGKDPKSSPGPSGLHLCCLCSLSPAAAPTDADWGSAIKVALTRCQPGQWRVV
jgi:hypothetical protein